MNARPASLAVFCGPSLPEEERTTDARVTYLAPAARHDVARAAKEYDLVLLIDGVFHHDLAPSPKECYAALSHARMFGASSMGALRAAECAPFGFTPLGAIANRFARGVLDGDDEVAVLTHPTTQVALTVPLVNVRYAAWLAYRRRILTREERDRLILASRAVFYMDRTWDDVFSLVHEDARDAFADIAVREGDLKRHDARFALRRAIRELDKANLQPFLVRLSPAERTTAGYEQSHTSPIRLPATMPKAPGTYDRAVPFEATLAILPQLRRRYGITRVPDTTYLDRTGIPTFAAMVPHSPDLLGVYNGKGITREGAMASAVMEATERQIGATLHLPVFQESLRVVGERIDLDILEARAEKRDRMVDCVLGTELFSGDAIPVPVAMVQCPFFGERLFTMTTTNGLASGNNLTEAIYHALCELIERHAWSMYHVRCSLRPRLFLGPKAKDEGLAPEITLPTGNPVVDRLVRQIREAGLQLRVLALPEGDLPVTMLAAITETASTPPMSHMGLGCALSPAHALIRALTEAVQSRVVDIQAAREDILRPGETAGVTGDHARRLSELPAGRWYYDVPSPRIAFDSLADRTSDDLAQDLSLALNALRDYGIPSVIAVDVSPPDLPIGVVRAIVPGLETYMVTNIMGPKARAVLNPFAVSAAL